MWRRMFSGLAISAVALMVFAVGFAECKSKPLMQLTTPQGQNLTIIGEARDRSEILDRARQMGFLARAPLKAFVEIEYLRLANLMIASAIDLSTSGNTLNWPAGQWIECVLTDSTVHRVRRVFTCGPREELRVIELGKQPVRVPLDQLFSARVRGIDYVGPPIYIAVPNTKVRGPDGRTYWMGIRDIAAIRFVQVPVDSLTAVAERRK